MKTFSFSLTQRSQQTNFFYKVKFGGWDIRPNLTVNYLFALIEQGEVAWFRKGISSTLLVTFPHFL